MNFLCGLWPYLAGGLIGWLLAGWFARRLKYVEPPVESIVEKHIDNPEHLALISKLETENRKIPDLVAKIASFSASSSAALSSTGSTSSTSTTPSAKIKMVEKIVEKKVDDPAHLRKISDLEAQLARLQKDSKIDIKAAKVAGLKIKTETDFTVIEGIGPQINDLLHKGGITSLAELSNAEPSRIQETLDAGGARFKIANPGTWPDQASLAVNNRWGALKALQDVLDGGVYPNGSKEKATVKKKAAVKKKTSSKKNPAKKVAPKLDADAAKAAGFKLKQKNGQDDFTLIEGVGPKINELIHKDGIHTFAELAETHVDAIQKVLDNAGARYKLAKPGTWPAQADMAANNNWDSLKAWQDELDGGV